MLQLSLMPLSLLSIFHLDPVKGIVLPVASPPPRRCSSQNPTPWAYLPLPIWSLPALGGV